jgi:SHS family lactate transporter-like MFS transporter
VVLDGTHTNELSPEEVRGTFPGFAYQLGNFFASSNLAIQTMIAQKYQNNFALALAVVLAAAALAIAIITACGREAKESVFGESR